MRKASRLLIALVVLLSGTILAPYAAFPSKKVGWQQFAGAYVYGETTDLAVTKSDAPDPVAVGDSLTYTIVVTNDGPDDATGVTLTDSLPDSVTLDSATASQGSCSGTSTITCDIGDLVAGDNVDVSIVVTPNTARTITNEVSVGGNETDPDMTNNTATVSTRVEESVGIVAGYNGQPHASKTVHLPMAARGDLNTDLFVQNTTGADADITLAFYDDQGSEVAVVTDTLSSYGSGVYDQATMDELPATFEGGAVVTSTQPIVAIGNARPSNANSLLSYNGIPASAAGETVILPSVGPNSYIWAQSAGANTTLTMTLKSSEGEPYYVITDTMPSQASRVYSLADISGLDVSVLSFMVLESDSPVAVINSGDASANNGIINADSSVFLPRLQGNVSGGVSFTSVLFRNVGVVSTTLTIRRYSKNGNLSSYSALLEPNAWLLQDYSDDWDAAVEAVADQPVVVDGWYGFTSDVYAGNTGIARSQLQTYAHLPRVARVIADGASTELSVQNAVTETAAVTITFYRASGTATTVLTDSIPAHGFSRYTTENMDVLGTDWEGSVIVEADQLIAVEAMQFEGKLTGTDLSVTKSDTVDPVAEGDILTYTLRATNNGPNEATGVVLSDTLPVSMTYSSASPSQGTCSESDGTVNCDLGTLSVDGSAEVTLFVTPQATGTVTNTVSIAGSEPDHNASNNTSTEDTTVILETDLSVTKSDSADLVPVGDPLTYTISVANNGPSDASGVTITDTLPVSVTYSSATTSQGSCSESSGVVTCTLGALPADDQATVTILVTSTATGTVNNLVEVAGNETDSNMDNNEAAEETTIAPLAPDVSLRKWPSLDLINEAQDILYSYRVTNTGTVVLSDVVVIDDKAGFIDNTGQLAVGQSKTVTATVLVVTDTTNVATATATSAYGTASASDSATVSFGAGEVECNPTIMSDGDGAWNDAATWNLDRIPTDEDVVMVQAGNVVTGPALANIQALCNYGTLRSMSDQSLNIRSTGFISNYGSIHGAHGGVGFGSTCGEPGSSIELRGRPIYNEGTIQAGDGGDGDRCGGEGGSTMVLGQNTINQGTICAGDGGDVLGTGQGRGGDGGDAHIWGKYRQYGGYLRNNGMTCAGDGGDGNASATASQMGGRGGRLKLISLPYVYLNGGQHYAGWGGQGTGGGGKGYDGMVIIEPNVISLAGKDTRVAGGDVVIFGGNDWTLDLSNMEGAAISATGKITLAVGSGGTVDLRGNESPVLHAGESVAVSSDKVDLDEGASLSDVADAPEASTSQSQVLYEVSLVGPGRTTGEPGVTLPISLTVLNDGPMLDTYTLSADATEGWSYDLQSSVEVDGLSQSDLTMDITPPSTAGNEDVGVITITASSQADSGVVETARIECVVKAEENKIYLPLVLRNGQ